MLINDIISYSLIYQSKSIYLEIGKKKKKAILGSNYRIVGSRNTLLDLDWWWWCYHFMFIYGQLSPTDISWIGKKSP